MSTHDDERFDDELEEDEGEGEDGPWAKTSSGDADSIVDDEDDED